jgi:hypothetical protein
MHSFRYCMFDIRVQARVKCIIRLSPLAFHSLPPGWPRMFYPALLRQSASQSESAPNPRMAMPSRRLAEAC